MTSSWPGLQFLCSRLPSSVPRCLSVRHRITWLLSSPVSSTGHLVVAITHQRSVPFLSYVLAPTIPTDCLTTSGAGRLRLQSRALHAVCTLTVDAVPCTDHGLWSDVYVRRRRLRHPHILPRCWRSRTTEMITLTTDFLLTMMHGTYIVYGRNHLVHW